MHVAPQSAWDSSIFKTKAGAESLDLESPCLFVLNIFSFTKRLCENDFVMFSRLKQILGKVM